MKNFQSIKFPIYSKNITNKITEIGVSSDLIEYKFKTMWMGLNQNNFSKYINLLPGKEKEEFLNKILIGNILSLDWMNSFMQK